ncbi:hypothetical protein BJP36_00345 [Moorena producens JHB]|uniref:Uncharacterized protein n=1 Tax=Moorena producens (strain JHB) TaxID=1454205 RepID=A0A1D9FTR5_MOOP1|nr:hypothetical protein [Moorena producens]AOY78560.1 hypothetical protein BJP36_00345 [Moorena producens JHB]
MLKILTDSAGKPLPVYNLLSYPTPDASGNGLTFRLTFYWLTFYWLTFYWLTFYQITYPTPNAKGEQ